MIIYNLKAMLVHSGVAVFGADPAPSNSQGFGRISVDRVLRSSSSDFDLFVADTSMGTPGLETDDSQCFCFTDRGNRNSVDTIPFKVSFTYS